MTGNDTEAASYDLVHCPGGDEFPDEITIRRGNLEHIIATQTPRVAGDRYYLTPSGAADDAPMPCAWLRMTTPEQGHPITGPDPEDRGGDMPWATLIRDRAAALA